MFIKKRVLETKTKLLIDAEEKIKEQNKLIKEIKKDKYILIKILINLKNKNEKQKKLVEMIEKLVYFNKCNNEKKIVYKIKKLVKDAQFK